LIFENTGEVIQAESHLKRAGYQIEVVAPPPEYRKGCDLAIKIKLIEAPGIKMYLLQAGLEPLEVLPLSSELKPASLYFSKDFGDYLMVRFANMKLTVEKKSFKVVNVSGGGCPDVPYLAEMLIGKSLKSPFPENLNQTLCGYALKKAYEKAKEFLCLE
jgi:hypothetical protein